MRTSQSITNLSKALLQAQKQMGAAIKGSKNPFFKSSYADLPTVMEVVKEPLNNAGVLVLQPPMHREGKNFIVTVLIHADSGEFMESETEVICSKPNDPQAFGAAQTYARRFGLQSMGFIPAEDDDGNAAAGRSAPKYQASQSGQTVTVKEVSANAAGALAASEASTSSGSVQATTVTPLKKSSFRSKKEAVAVNSAANSAAAPAATVQDDWN